MWSRHGGRSSVGRASGCGPEGRGFNPRRSPHRKARNHADDSGPYLVLVVLLGSARSPRGTHIIGEHQERCVGYHPHAHEQSRPDHVPGRLLRGRPVPVAAGPRPRGRRPAHQGDRGGPTAGAHGGPPNPRGPGGQRPGHAHARRVLPAVHRTPRAPLHPGHPGRVRGRGRAHVPAPPRAAARHRDRPARRPGLDPLADDPAHRALAGRSRAAPCRHRRPHSCSTMWSRTDRGPALAGAWLVVVMSGRYVRGRTG